jgi:hypothetical protein
MTNINLNNAPSNPHPHSRFCICICIPSTTEGAGLVLVLVLVPVPGPRAARTPLPLRALLEAHRPVLGVVPPGVYQGTFAKPKSGPRTPRPPGGPPVLGPLVRSAEGLPSA